MHLERELNMRCGLCGTVPVRDTFVRRGNIELECHWASIGSKEWGSFRLAVLVSDEEELEIKIAKLSAVAKLKALHTPTKTRKARGARIERTPVDMTQRLRTLLPISKKERLKKTCANALEQS